MAISLLNPGSWGWDQGGQFPTGQSASLKPKTQVLGTQTQNTQTQPFTGSGGFNPVPTTQYSGPIGPVQPDPTIYNTSAGRANTSMGTASTSGPQPYNPNVNISSPSDQMGGSSLMDVISREYSDFNNYLDQQERTSNQNFTDYTGLLGTQKEHATEQYKQDQATQTREAKSTEALNLKRVRQLLADLSQKDAAKIAVGGGGSMTEALGERFGRKAQEGLGNVMDATQKAIQRSNDFYSNATVKLQDSYDMAIQQAKSKLDETLNSIGLQRNQSATTKQKSSIDAWRDYYNNVNKAKTDAASYNAQLDIWKKQLDSQNNAAAGFKATNTGEFNNQIASTYNQPSILPNIPTAPAQSIAPVEFGVNNTTQEDKTKQALMGNYFPTQ